MKVLFIGSGNNAFGISPIIQTQGRSLEKCGLDIDYFLIKRKGFIGYMRATKELKQHLKTNNYNVLHAHYGLCGNITLLAAGKNAPLLVSYMGDDLLGEHKPGGKKSPSGNLYVVVNRRQARHYNKWSIVKTNEMLESLRGVENITVLPNGVNFDDFKPIDMKIARTRIGLDPNGKYILFPADPKRSEKNYTLAEQAVQLVKKKYPKTKLLTVFDKEQSELNMYYNAVDLTLLTSYHEGSPNIIKEAMACNCPIVSTPVGDVQDIIGNSDGCYLASFDPENIKEKIIESFMFARRTNGRTKIEHLRTEIIAKNLVQIYHRIMAM